MLPVNPSNGEANVSEQPFCVAAALIPTNEVSQCWLTVHEPLRSGHDPLPVPPEEPLGVPDESEPHEQTRTSARNGVLPILSMLPACLGRWIVASAQRDAPRHEIASGLTMESLCPTLLGMSRRSEPKAAAETYAELFPAIYLRFHRRDGKRRELSSASRGVLLHLAGTGPLTVSDCAKHLGRAQSVVSEIVDQLEGHGLLARVRDDADRRRTLVWLTDSGRERLVEEQQVLSTAALEHAFAGMTSKERTQLIEGTRALLRCATGSTTKEK
jgi:DNA-binding MarR family transcriptional regulator